MSIFHVPCQILMNITGNFCTRWLIDSKWSQSDHGALGHHQQPRQAQLWRAQQVPVMFIKKWHDTCLYAVFQRQIDLKQSQRDTGWSRGSRTPSATSTSSTKASTASTSYVHQKLTWHMFICYFSKTNRFKTVQAWYRVIKRLSDPSATSSS